MRALSIALIRPPVVVLTEGLSHIGPTPPVGLAYVAAALRGAGHRITVIDAPGLALEPIERFDVAAGRVRRIGLSPREVAERIAPETDIVGITNMFAHEWPTVREIAELARRRVPDARVIVGGENPTSFWPWMFEQTDAIDVAVLGEGERTIVAVADRVADGTSLHGLAGVALPEVAEASEEPCLPTRIRDVESIDRPAWDLFPMDAYFRYRSFLGVDRGRSMPILATRGCPYECSFCSAPNMWTTRYHVREPVEIVDEIQSYVESYRDRERRLRRSHAHHQAPLDPRVLRRDGPPRSRGCRFSFRLAHAPKHSTRRSCVACTKPAAETSRSRLRPAPNG